MRRISKKSAVIGIFTALVVAVSAYAYLSSTGSGSGSGSTTVTAGSVDLSGTTPAIAKIGDSATMTITAKNNSTSPVKVASISVGTITLPANCPTDSFEIATPTATGVEVAPGETETVGSAVVTFVNQNAVQNSCTSFTAALSSN